MDDPERDTSRVAQKPRSPSGVVSSPRVTLPLLPSPSREAFSSPPRFLFLSQFKPHDGSLGWGRIDRWKCCGPCVRIDGEIDAPRRGMFAKTPPGGDVDALTS